MNSIDTSYVRVHFWPSDTSSDGSSTIGSLKKAVSSLWRANSGVSFGHAAIETFTENSATVLGTYMSLWPGKCRGDYCHNFDSHWHTLEQDKKAMGETGYTFYRVEGLDVAKINKVWDDFKASGFRWSLLAGAFSKPYEKNCAGLVLYLMEAGGLSSAALDEARPFNYFLFGLAALSSGLLFHITDVTLAEVQQWFWQAVLLPAHYRTLLSFIEVYNDILDTRFNELSAKGKEVLDSKRSRLLGIKEKMEKLLSAQKNNSVDIPEKQEELLSALKTPNPIEEKAEKLLPTNFFVGDATWSKCLQTNDGIRRHRVFIRFIGGIFLSSVAAFAVVNNYAFVNTVTPRDVAAIAEKLQDSPEKTAKMGINWRLLKKKTVISVAAIVLGMLSETALSEALPAKASRFVTIAASVILIFRIIWPRLVNARSTTPMIRV